ncbi:MAG: right-handed parallel beta-helix repeat-containing protein [Thermodesulfobacteriota bacterium]|nr:right-handed parallel beta-helix repeat-containing protein [Thermodesulfobacteriota bacterium]
MKKLMKLLSIIICVSAFFVPVQTFAAPTLSSVIQDTADNRGTVMIAELIGSGFEVGDEVALKKNGQNDILLLPIVKSSTEMVAIFDAKCAEAGSWNLVVTSKSGEIVKLMDAITLVSVSAPVVASTSPFATPVKISRKSAQERLAERLKGKVKKTSNLKLRAAKLKSPSQNSNTKMVELTGSGFESGDKVAIVREGKANIEVLAAVISSTKILGIFDTDDTKIRSSRVVVTKQNGKSKSTTLSGDNALIEGSSTKEVSAPDTLLSGQSMAMMVGDIYVPADYLTIQEAINNAINGDTIHVSPGTYTENINFQGKAISIVSTDGPEVTLIDGGALDVVVTFWNNEGNDSILDGFTITNGNGGFGGGIGCIEAGPTINNCIITANIGYWGGGNFFWGRTPNITNCIIADNIADDSGAGIYCGSNALITVTNCTISDNAAANYGGGVRVCVADMVVVNSIFWGDVANGAPNEINLAGGTVDISYSDIEGGYVGIGNIDQDPLFVGNGDYHITPLSNCIDLGTSVGAPSDDIDGDYRPLNNGHDMGADEHGDAIYVPSEYGAIQEAIENAVNGFTIVVDSGTYYENINFLGKSITLVGRDGPEATVIDGGGLDVVVTFWNNEGNDSVLKGFTITNGNGGFGGGIGCIGAGPTVEKCIISANTGYWGGGVFFWGRTPTITNCNIIDNTAGDSGAGIYCGTNASLTAANCTISDNTATNNGGGVRVYGGAMTAINCVFWGDTAAGVPNEINLPGGTVDITYSDIQGGYAGVGNIDEDPLFVGAGDYHLTMNSGCIDSGTASSAPSDDIDGDARPQANGYDMGADECL